MFDKVLQRFLHWNCQLIFIRLNTIKDFATYVPSFTLHTVNLLLWKWILSFTHSFQNHYKIKIMWQILGREAFLHPPHPHSWAAPKNPRLNRVNLTINIILHFLKNSVHNLFTIATTVQEGVPWKKSSETFKEKTRKIPQKKSFFSKVAGSKNELIHTYLLRF